MKRYIHILALILPLASCVKDLDTLPLNRTDPVSEFVYGTDEEGYVSGLARLYFQFVSNDLTDLQSMDGGASNTQSYGGTTYLLSATLASTDITDLSRPNGQRNGWAGLRVPFEYVDKYFNVITRDYETGEYEVGDKRGEVFYIKGRKESMDGALYSFMNGWSCLKFSNIPAGQTEEFLMAERARELMWEAHRRTDLIRYGLYNTSDYLWPYKGGDSYAGQAFPQYKCIFPLPQTELATNVKLVQNPGYTVPGGE